MSLELNDSFHIIIRNGCLVNFVSEVKEKRTVLKVFIKCESWGGVKSCLYVSLVIFLYCDIKEVGFCVAPFCDKSYVFMERV